MADPESESGRANLPRRDQQALAAVAAQFFANGAMTASFVARAPQLRDNIGVDLGTYGFLLTLCASVGILGSLLAGRIVHAATTRRVIAAGAVAMVMSLPIIGRAQSPHAWLTGMFLYAFFDTLVDISMNLQGSWLSARRSAPIMNRLHGLWSVGTLAGGLGAVAANALGWSPSIHLSLVAVTMAIVLASATRHLLDEEDGHEGGGNGADIGLTDRAGSRGVLPVVLIVLAGMFAVVMETMGGDWATFRLADDLGASAAVASAAFVAFTGGMVTMRLAGDHLQLWLGKLLLHRASILLSLLGFAVVSLVDSQAASVMGFLLVGLGVATFMPRLYDDAARIPGRRGTGLGAMTAGMRVALLLTPALVGALVDGGSSVGAAIAVCSVPAAAGLIVVAEWQRRGPGVASARRDAGA